MKLQKEISELVRDPQVWARTVISLLPAILSFLLNVEGNSDVLFNGLYTFLFLFIGSNSLYILRVKKIIPGVRAPGNEKPDNKLVDKYPASKPYATAGLVLNISFTLIFIFVHPFNNVVTRFVYGTSTSVPTPTKILTLEPPQTVTPTPSPRPISDSLYYMIVLDASEKMKESFHGQSKWEVALNSLTAIINGLNPRAKYGLVVIGGSNSSGIGDPCGEPSTMAIPFSGREIVWNQIGQLEPYGGGSFYTAFTLAKNELQNLPSNTIKTLIYITGSSDACEERDEWADLERILQIPDATVGLYSEIIILDENAGLETQTIKERISSMSENVNIQIPQSIPALQQSNNTVINNVIVYVENKIETRATDIPVPPTFTSTSLSTRTPVPTDTLTPNTPSALQAALEEVDRQLKDSLKANIVYDTPEEMELDESFTIELLLNPSLSPTELITQIVESSNLDTATARPRIFITDPVGNLITSTPEPGNLVTARGADVDIVANEVEITNRMKAVLTSNDPDAFSIQSLHDNSEQAISSVETTAWRWSITAKKEGTKTLELVIYRFIKIDGNEYWRAVETYRTDIIVKVTAAQRFGKFNWEWILGIAVSLLLIPAFWRWYDNGKKQKESDTSTVGKYMLLKRYLVKMPKSISEITLSFAEIEEILNEKLPRSAKRYRSWWTNETKSSHVQANAWLDEAWT